MPSILNGLAEWSSDEAQKKSNSVNYTIKTFHTDYQMRLAPGSALS